MPIIQKLASSQGRKDEEPNIALAREIARSGDSEAFAAVLGDKNNRLVWGAMTALDAVASCSPELIYRKLPVIMEAADSGSVIAKDHAVGILIKLSAIEAYAGETFPMLLAQLRNCPTNQLPMYAENALPLIRAGNKEAFKETLLDRLIEIEKDSKRKRVEKVINKAEKR